MIKKFKNAVPWIYVTEDFNRKEIGLRFSEKGKSKIV